MRAADVIRKHREGILAGWPDVVSAALPEGRELTDSALLNSLPEFLDELAAWLESDGKQFRATAAEHGVTRLRSDVDPLQFVAEYSLLRFYLLDLIRTHGSANDVDLRRLHQAVDASIAASAAAFIGSRADETHQDRTAAAERRTTVAETVQRAAEAAQAAAETAQRAADARVSQAEGRTAVAEIAQRAAETAQGAAEAAQAAAEAAQRAAEARAAEAEGRTAVAEIARRASEAARLSSEAARLAAEVRERATEEARSRAEKTAADVELFMAILAHDLRTPLSTIMIAASIMTIRGDLSPGDTNTASRIARSGDRMNRMIEQLLDFTRIRLGGGLLPKKDEVDLRQLLEQLIGEFELTSPGRTIRLESAGAGQVRCDRGQVSQALSNLLRNAVEHSPDGTPIGVAVRGDPSSVEITVHNEGPPIALDVMPRLFDPFRRGERGSKGLGLGLYITQQIARAHGGDVEARSDEEAGTTFTVRLPRG